MEEKILKIFVENMLGFFFKHLPRKQLLPGFALTYYTVTPYNFYRIQLLLYFLELHNRIVR
ncbi:MAG: hypothetical protein ACK4NF_01030 [Planctomycetota bacterium]